MKFSTTVSAAEAGQNLIHFCKRRLELPHSGLQKAFRTKAIRLNGAKDDGKTILRAGDTITALFPFKEGTSSPRRAPKLTPHILFEDDEFLVLNKPAGLAVHGGSGQEMSMDLMVRFHYAGAPFLPQPAHRLDKDTSGVLIYGKTIDILQRLGQALQSHTIQKTYHALVHGHLERHEGTITARLSTQENARTKTVVDPNGKEAITEYRIVQEFTEYTLVELHPTTGRTHQLRVHLAHIGHPIIGDTRYGDSELDARISTAPERLYLHCAHMKLPEQISSTQKHFTAPTPFPGK